MRTMQSMIRRLCLLLLGCLLMLSNAEQHIVGNITRREEGDSFLLNGPSCGPVKCSEFGGGAPAAVGRRGNDACECSCPTLAPLFREDLAQCVDDIEECALANFGSGSSAQKIPFVFLPLRGQIIHPSKEITFPGVKTPICAVSGAQFLTRRGFADLRNTVDADVPFALFRDEGRTFLQWSGEPELRVRMSGRAVVVRLLCRDVTPPARRTTPPSPLDLRGVFTPCVAFRVQGSPARLITNISEVQFVSNAHSSEDSSSPGLTVSEYVAIGISSILLGLIYVASVFLYLHVKKKKQKLEEAEKKRKKSLKGLRNKDGSILRDHDIIRIDNDRLQTLPDALEPTDDGVVKSNPLLSLGKHFHDIKGSYPSDSGSAISDNEDNVDRRSNRDDDKRLTSMTAAIVHPMTSRINKMESKIRRDIIDSHLREESNIEKLPDEHVSIVETNDTRDDKPEIVRSMGNTRRKLYFNPAFFDPQLMANPPQEALDFLTKIREVISIARHKMAAKRFQPVLNEILEEDTYHTLDPSFDFYQGVGSQRSSSLSLKRENFRRRTVDCVGCPGCRTKVTNNLDLMNVETVKCQNCVKKHGGEKHNSIRKWLDEIPSDKILNADITMKDIKMKIHNSGMLSSMLSLPMDGEERRSGRAKSLYSEDFKTNINFKNKDTLSVRSEPPRRSFNLPLPDFSSFDCKHNNYRSTIAKAEDIKPIGLPETKSRPQPILNQCINKFITNKHTMPDMINEALAIDNSNSVLQSSSEDEIGNCKKQFRKGDNLNDYETDSLERATHNKDFSTPDYSDITPSQASPNSSAALPLEEELTIRNDVYKPPLETTNMKKEDLANYYETLNDMKAKDTLKIIEQSETYSEDYSLVSEVYVNNNFGSNPSSPCGSNSSFGTKKEAFTETEEAGKLTIVLQDPPENYITIHESDGFEPDTLDRKQSKPGKIIDDTHFSRKELLNNINSDNNSESDNPTSTFNSHDKYTKKNNTDPDYRSLDIYEKNTNSITRNYPSIESYLLSETKRSDEDSDWNTEEGKILTLEMRHSKRQRQVTPPSIKQLKCLVRPDVIPPLPPMEDSIYEHPKPPRKVDTQNLISTKNCKDRSLSPRQLKTFFRPKIKCLTMNKGNDAASASVNNTVSDYENLPEIANNDSDYKQIDTNTFVKNVGKSDEKNKRRLQHKEDSGYLSSDSNSPRFISRKMIVQKALSGTESEDTENEARSESGAESVETHSVFFGSLRKLALQPKEKSNTIESKKSFFKRGNSKKSPIKIDRKDIKLINCT